MFSVEGAFDLHVHSGPDILKRKVEDNELCQRLLKRGMSGYVIKSHYINTAERASVLRQAYPGCNVHGSLCLNNAVGGLNVAAVYVGVKSGIRMLYFPTSDSAHELDELFTGTELNPDKKIPMWGQICLAMRQQHIPCPGISLLDDRGALRSEVMDILKLAAEGDICVATGHISHGETFAAVKAAKELGVRRILITHVTFPTTFYTLDEQRALIDMGARVEHCFTSYSTGKVEFETIREHIRAIGPEHVVISTDLGQPANLYPDDGMVRFSQDLHDAGFTAAEIKRMNGENPRDLILP